MRDDEPRWHPIMAAHEGPTGVWRMIDPMGKEYGRIELRRVNDGSEVRYKAVWRDEVLGWRDEVLGWATSLREACDRVHYAYIRDHSPGFRSGAPQEWELELERQRPSSVNDE